MNGPAEMLAADKASTALGIAPIELRDDYASLRMTVAENMIYDITVRRGTEIVAEFRGRSRTLRA
jgi:hypothetical protein